MLLLVLVLFLLLDFAGPFSRRRTRTRTRRIFASGLRCGSAALCPLEVCKFGLIVVRLARNQKARKCRRMNNKLTCHRTMRGGSQPRTGALSSWLAAAQRPALIPR